MPAGITYGINWGPNNTMYFGSGYPTSTTDGTYQQGDVIVNCYPSSAGTFGWVCTTGGSPGTWSKVTMSSTP